MQVYNIIIVQNSTKVDIFDEAKKVFVSKFCNQLKVGDIVKCYSDETFPADLALLTSSSDGDCFIATGSLDGEKNLKKRVQPKDLKEHFPLNTTNEPILGLVQGELQCEPPNKDLHSYTGQIVIKGKYFTLSDKQLLLKGANLKNTNWVLGMCVYSGNDTKIMLNSQKGRQKMSYLETMLN